MSSKIGADSRQRWSLAARLTVWNSALAIVLISTVTAYSYWVLTSNLDREDDEFLTSRLSEIAARLRNDPDALLAIETAWREDTAEPPPLHILVRVLAPDGTPVAAMRGSEDVPWPPPFRGSLETGEWRLLAQNTDSFMLQAALDRRQESAFLWRYRRQLYMVLFIATVACIAGGVLLARHGLSPLRELSSVAAGIGVHRLGERLDPSKYASELEQVASTFNGMLDRLQESFEQLNRFSGDIAHELRTPLHNLRGEIEVTLSKGRSEDEYRDALGSCLEETVQLSSLIDSLLFLAQSERPHLALRKETLKLDDELKTIQEFYSAAAEEAGVRFIVASQPGLQITADRTLFQRAIGNLITNALNHTPSSGQLEIRGEENATSTVVRVSDTGVGIPPDQLPHVFDRLFRGDSPGTISTAGHGLGLSIVKTIVELHGGQVSIHSTRHQGTTIETAWPNSKHDH